MRVEHVYEIKQTGRAGKVRLLQDIEIRTIPDAVILSSEQGLDSVAVSFENLPLLIDTLRQIQAMRS